MNRTHKMFSLVILSALSANVFADSSVSAQSVKSAEVVNDSERLFLLTRPARRDVSKITTISTVTSVNKDASGKIVSYEIASEQGAKIIKADTLDATHTEAVESKALIENLKAKSADHFIDIDKGSVGVLVNSMQVPSYRADKLALASLQRFLEHRPNYARTGLARFGALWEASQNGKIDRSVKPPVDPRSAPVNANLYGGNRQDPKKHPNMSPDELGAAKPTIKSAVQGATEDAVRE